MKNILKTAFLMLLAICSSGEPVELKTGNFFSPEFGHITITFSPKWAADTNSFQTGHLFNARHYSTTLKRNSGPILGINRSSDGKSYIWIYLINPENGKDWGIYLPFELRNDQEYNIELHWRLRHVKLLSDGVTVGETNLPFDFELAESCIVGGRGASAKTVELKKYKIHKSVEKINTISADTSDAKFKCIKDSKTEFSFEFENPAGNSVLAIMPANLTIKKGHRYYVNCAAPELFPHEVTAGSDGKLELKLPSILRTAITISPTSGTLLPKFGAEYYQTTRICKDDTVNWLSEAGTEQATLTKTSPNHTLWLTSQEVKAEAGKTYFASGLYRWTRSHFNTAFGLYIFVYADGRLVATDNNRHETSFPVFQKRRNEWNFFQKTIKIPEKYHGSKITAKIAVALDGHPGVVTCRGLDLREKPLQAVLKGRKANDIVKLLTSEELKKYLSDKKHRKVAVSLRDNRPVLELDDRIEPLLPVWAARPEVAGIAREQGIRILIATARVNNWNQPKGSAWIGIDKYDFSVIDRSIEELLLRHPDAGIILSLSGLAYRDFAKEHPASAWVTAKGSRGQRFFNTVPEAAYSLISGETRREVGKFMNRLGQHLKDSVYGKAVIGVHITGGSDGQWYAPLHPWSFKNLDYSEGSRLAAAEVIRAQYGNNLEALRRAWRKPDITFETIQLPKVSELESKHLLLGARPGDRYLIDTVTACHQALVGTIDHFAMELKAGIGRPILVLTYAPDNAIMTKKELVHAKYIDGYVCLPSYLRQRSAGGSSFSAGQPHGSYLMHGKLFLGEVDFRTEYSEIANRANRYWLGMGDGLNGHFNQLRREFASQFSTGFSGWFRTVDQTGQYAWSGDFAPIMGEIIRAANHQLNKPALRIPPQVIVFQDDRYQAAVTYAGRKDHYLSHSRTTPELVYSGLTFKNYLLSDLENPERETARIYYFQSAASLTEPQIRWIEKNLQKDGNILIFAGDAGRLSGIEPDIALRRLCGISITAGEETQVSYSYRSDLIPGRQLIGLPGNSLWLQRFKGPFFKINDGTATTIALLEDTDSAGIAFKPHSGWSAVYIGGSAERAMTAEFWRKLAAMAQIRPVGPSGDVTFAGHGIAMIHAVTPGIKKLCLPASADVTDLITGQLIAHNVESLEFPMEFGQTRYFGLQPSRK